MNGATDVNAMRMTRQTPTYMERLRTRWRTAQTLLCVGLDVELERLPTPLRAQVGAMADGVARDEDAIAEALLAFNRAIITATAPYVCAFKPNAAFYEAQGFAGFLALRETIAFIHTQYPDIPVLLDAKRGDIGSTSQAYARAAFDVLRADAVTTHPYLGREALAPFLERAERGVFVLCRTSNVGAGELQDLRVPVAGGAEQATEPLYLAVARRVAREWNTLGNCGLVVGATYPEELRQVREVVGDLPILLPGIGAQGGDLAGSLRAGVDGNGEGLLMSASRSVLYASSGADFAEAAGAEARRLAEEIARLR